jgi:hypothetical protein
MLIFLAVKFFISNSRSIFLHCLADSGMEFDWSTKTKQFHGIRSQQFRHRTKNLLATSKRYRGKGIQLVDDFEQVTRLFVLLGETTNNINSAK